MGIDIEESVRVAKNDMLGFWDRDMTEIEKACYSLTSNQVAYIPDTKDVGVLRFLNKIDLPKEIARDCTLQSWSNGREQGLCISYFAPDLKSKMVVFAQQRSSDAILIVGGHPNDFCINHQPSDALWVKDGARVTFDADDHDKAVKYIEKFLTSKK